MAKLTDADAAQVLAAVALSMQYDGHNDGTDMALASLNNAICALQKQVPREASRKNGLYVSCPCCKTEVLPFKHCPECGQALK